ncbi:MAG: phosphoribosylglycinamide formyltransferase [Proteobacteria bacterium]|nr:phosphoribosylglycinamide formyltransferase [Pseudomonadota bacterium]
MRIAVFASQTGTILQAIIDACETGTLNATVVLVVSNNSGAEALRRASEHGIRAVHLSGRTHPDEGVLDRAIMLALKEADVEWVVLAGYMKKLGPETLSARRFRVVNTHPALLPKFGGQGFFGDAVHQAVLDAGETESGATVHLVEGDYDTGPILSQVRVPVKPKDTVQTLKARVQNAERNLIVHTLMELSTHKKAIGY